MLSRFVVGVALGLIAAATLTTYVRVESLHDKLDALPIVGFNVLED